MSSSEPSVGPSVTAGDETWLYLAALGRGLLRSHLVGRVDLSGVIQQTLLEAVAARDGFPAGRPGEERAWLTQVFRHNLLDAVRRETAAGRDAGRDVSLAAAEPDLTPLADLLAADQSTPSSRASWEEEILRLARALAGLPADQRRVIELRYLHGRSVGDIAAELARSKPAVASLLKRGLQTLRELLPPPGG
jgi:RNA polymerase sigma-70 factor, ECF subfamily